MPKTTNNDPAAMRAAYKAMLKEAGERITWLESYGVACGLAGRIPEAKADRQRIERRLAGLTGATT